jgi:hypothetical protein
LVELVKKMPVEYFISKSDSLKDLVTQSIAEIEGKRAKLKKCSLAVLHEIKQKIGSIE